MIIIKQSRAVKTAPLNRSLTDVTEVTSVRRRESCGRSIRPKLRGHKAFRAMAEAHEDGLSGPKLGKTIAPQRFHMHEDVLRALSPRQEAEALEAVEPFHHRALPVAFGDNGDMRALWQLRGMDRSAFIHSENAECL